VHLEGEVSLKSPETDSSHRFLKKGKKNEVFQVIFKKPCSEWTERVLGDVQPLSKLALLTQQSETP
jgi:hypothetical protein